MPPPNFSFPSSLGVRQRCDAINLDLSSDEQFESPAAGKTAASSSSTAMPSSVQHSQVSPDPVSPRPDTHFKVLVDLNEKPNVRKSICEMLPSAVQMRLPGVDYAFG